MFEYFSQKKILNTKAGFTLIEIIICMMVLGILVAVAVPIYSVNKTHTQKKVCNSNMRTLYDILETQLVNEFAVESETGYFKYGTPGVSKTFYIYHYFYYDKTTGEQKCEETQVAGNYDCLFTANDSKAVATKFLKNLFVSGDIPYCPYNNKIIDKSKSRKYNKVNYYYSVSGIAVKFKFDEDGEPYITKISCNTKNSEHGSVTKK